MLEGSTFGEWKLTGPLDRRGTYPASNEAGTQAVMRVVESVTPERTAELSKAAEDAAKLLHPDAAGVLGWGVEGETFWIATEPVSGADLDEYLRDRGGRVSADVAAGLLVHVAAALAAAHSAGLVHGAVRPDNVIVGTTGIVKLLGLGVPEYDAGAALRHGVPPEAAHCVSPEQAAGKAPVAASDVYSVGVMAYRMVTGTVPFDGPDAPAVSAQHLAREPEPLRRVNPDVPPSFEEVALAALAKDPAVRPSADRLRDDFERIAKAGPLVAGKRPGRVWPWVLAASLIVALAAAGVGGAWYLGYFQPKTPVPDLTGMQPATATAALKNAQLTAGDITYRADVPSGTVIGSVVGQDPAPGSRVGTGTAVDIVIAGSEMRTVPSVIGVDQIQAIIALEGAGFRLSGVETTYNPNAPAGMVVSQIPSAGVSAAKDSTVTLVVSRGAESLAVPNAVGQKKADAEKALKAAGLVITFQTEYNSTVSSSTVIRQEPAGGVTTTKGAAVTVWLSKGAQKVVVPNVIGLTQAEALDDLQDLDLRIAITYQPSATPTGKVTKQDPTKGRLVLPRSTVTITVDMATP